VRRDSMAMKPFCGYNFGDYWAHWFSFEQRTQKLPKVFHVNWFRQDKNGKFMWPGFGDNLRVLKWIFDRCEGKVDAQDTAIGYLPHAKDLDVSGLNIDPATLEQLLSIDAGAWRHEMADIGKYLNDFGQRTPERLREEHAKVVKRLG